MLLLVLLLLLLRVGPVSVAATGVARRRFLALETEAKVVPLLALRQTQRQTDERVAPLLAAFRRPDACRRLGTIAAFATRLRHLGIYQLLLWLIVLLLVRLAAARMDAKHAVRIAES